MRNRKNIPLPQVASGWGPGFINAVREVRIQNNLIGLRESLDLIATHFAFESWDELRPWLREADVDWTNIRGPHTMTLLKMLAIKHGRNVSTGR